MKENNKDREMAKLFWYFLILMFLLLPSIKLENMVYLFRIIKLFLYFYCCGLLLDDWVNEISSPSLSL
jgi:hypothetical protein